MPTSLPPSPSGATFNAMPFVPEDDDDMPALQEADGSLPQIVIPESEAPPTENSGHSQPSSQANTLPPNFAAVFGTVYSWMQSTPTTAAAPTAPAAAQSAHNDVPHSSSSPSGGGGSNNQGAAPTPSHSHMPPPHIMNLLQTALSAGPPAGFPTAPYMAGTPFASYVPPYAAANYSPNVVPGHGDGAGDTNDWEGAPSDEEDDMPPLEEAVPSSSLPSHTQANAVPSTTFGGAFFMHGPILFGSTLGGGLSNTQGSPTNEAAGPVQDDAPQDGPATAQSAASPPSIFGDLPSGVLPPESMMAAFNAAMTAAYGEDDADYAPATDAMPPFLPPFLPPGSAELENILAAGPIVFETTAAGGITAGFSSSLWPPMPRRQPFDAAAFVDTLEEVNISTIPEEDIRCPHCWLPFGVTEENDPAFAAITDPEVSPELEERQNILHEMPFDTYQANNDPVRTPCGHIFGKACLLESLEKVNTACPTCRQELRPPPVVPLLGGPPLGTPHLSASLVSSEGSD
ncbi:hypothetical protein CC86DRAFT_388237 [Ophiobolus disseminans]|uniref:RING-type domain-containing protein n=1 Tax=Ophiobolus disseminans TaxID=1469910 RepID=A0A6A6ZF11_9PLEO|nr:hypothetical protein CC86DRAFT_388237 [Ophiobolus disseminans]